LTDENLPFWVDVRVSQIGGCWIAIAALADTPEIVASSWRDLAVLLALWPLGATHAQELAARAIAQLDAPLGALTPEIREG
jgi:hypothetical protein